MMGATNMNNPFLIGEHIYLRPLGAETDLDRCLRWINDPEVLVTLGRRQPMGAPPKGSGCRDSTRATGT